MFNKSQFSNIPIYFVGILWIALIHLPVLNAQKINGMCFSGPSDPSLTLEMLESIKISNANWIALVPEATLDRTTLMLLPDEQNHWWSETIEANIQAIQLAKQADLKVFLKPHVVLSKIEKINPSKAVFTNNNSVAQKSIKDKTRGVEWRGDLSLKKETDWRIVERSYEKYILQLAEVAEAQKVDLFAVGTELKKFSTQRPAFWRQLIQKVRKIYKGPITYAANWDEYHKISFWQDLDYIGVDTYFPINRMKTPEVRKTIKNWRAIQKQLRKFSKAEDRQIILTEFGYRNVSYAGKRPWTHDKGEKIPPNNQAQVNLYQAFFHTFWKKSWIAGGFAWKWFAQPKSGKDTSFSVQGKPALTVLQKWYAQTQPDVKQR